MTRFGRQDRQEVVVVPPGDPTSFHSSDVENAIRVYEVLNISFEAELFSFNGHSLFMNRIAFIRNLPRWTFGYIGMLLVSSVRNRTLFVFNQVRLGLVALLIRKMLGLHYTIIYYYANPPFDLDRKYGSQLQRLLNRFSVAIVLRSVEGVVFNRDAEIPYTLRALPRSQISIPEPVVNTESVCFKDKERIRIRNLLALSDKKVVGIVGPFRKNNALPSVSYVLNNINRFSQDVHFLFIGAIADADRFTHPRATFTGYVQDLAAYLSAADCLLLPRFFHYGAPMGKAIFAMSVGLPVITNMLEGMPVIDKHEIILGKLDDLPQLVSVLLRNPEDAKRIGQNARRAIETKYSVRLWHETLPDFVRKRKTNFQPHRIRGFHFLATNRN